MTTTKQSNVHRVHDQPPTTVWTASTRPPSITYFVGKEADPWSKLGPRNKPRKCGVTLPLPSRRHRHCQHPTKGHCLRHDREKVGCYRAPICPTSATLFEDTGTCWSTEHRVLHGSPLVGLDSPALETASEPPRQCRLVHNVPEQHRLGSKRAAGNAESAQMTEAALRPKRSHKEAHEKTTPTSAPTATRSPPFRLPATLPRRRIHGPSQLRRARLHYERVLSPVSPSFHRALVLV